MTSLHFEAAICFHKKKISKIFHNWVIKRLDRFSKISVKNDLIIFVLLWFWFKKIRIIFSLKTQAISADLLWDVKVSLFWFQPEKLLRFSEESFQFHWWITRGNLFRRSSGFFFQMTDQYNCALKKKHHKTNLWLILPQCFLN